MTHPHGPGESISPVISEYLQMVYNLEMEGEPAHGAALARRMGVSRANVSATLKRMTDAGLTVGGGRGDVELTPEGRRQAELALRRHRLAERYLQEALGLDWIAAHEEAHHFEAAMTPVVEAAILARLGNPTTCPHGNPIPGQVPDAAGYLRSQEAVRLTQAQIGASMRVVAVSEIVEDETALLRYVGEKGLRPGGAVRVSERSPDGAALQLVVEGGRQAAVSADLAYLIWVRAA